MLSVDLISKLDEIYPEQTPDPSTKLSDRELWARAGERRLVRGLVAKIKEQEELGTDTKILK